MTELAPELEAFRAQLLANRARAAELLAGLTDAELLERPAAGRWSVAECLDHLNATALAGLALLDGALAEAEARGLRGQGPFRMRALVRWFARSMEPPARFRTRTRRAFVPAAALEPGRVAREFMALQDRMLAQLERADGYHLEWITVASPFAGWLRYRLVEWFAVMLAHERRHLWQAEQAAAAVRARPTAPR